MELTEFQKKIVIDISNEIITDAASFIIKYFQYETLGEQNNYFIFLDTNIKEKIKNELVDFYQVIKLLEKENLLLLINKPVPEKKIIKIFFGGPPEVEYRLCEMLQTISDKFFLPALELYEYINRGYETKIDKAYYEENKSRKTAQIITIGVALFTIIIATILNIVFNNNERVITIKNPQKITDTLNVKIVPDTIDTLTNNKNAL